MNGRLIVVIGVLTLMALGFVWLMIRSVKRSGDPEKLLFKYVLSLAIIVPFSYFVLYKQWGNSHGGAFVVPFLCVTIGIILSLLWTPNIGAVLAKPITSLFDGGDTEPEPQPLYSIALAKRKSGKYREALYDIQQELDKFPEDVSGQMLLAEILVENLDDLSGAQNTVERLCQQPNHAPKSIAYALNTLADWQLRYGQDIEAARQALERIVARYPGTEEAQVAAQRIAHLGSTETLLAAREPAKIYMKPGVRNIGLMKDSSSLQPKEEDPSAKAAEYVQHLAEYPADTEIREKLALIYADHYQRLDLATLELNQLIEQPNQPAKQVVRWLHVLCDLQVKHIRDEQIARETLQRIIDRFPGLAAAETARTRLQHLPLEIHGRKQTETIPLGEYEQNLGLRMGRPREG